MAGSQSPWRSSAELPTLPEDGPRFDPFGHFDEVEYFVEACFREGDRVRLLRGGSVSATVSPEDVRGWQEVGNEPGGRRGVLVRLRRGAHVSVQIALRAGDDEELHALLSSAEKRERKDDGNDRAHHGRSEHEGPHGGHEGHHHEQHHHEQHRRGHHGHGPHCEHHDGPQGAHGHGHHGGHQHGPPGGPWHGPPPPPPPHHGCGCGCHQRR